MKKKLSLVILTISFLLIGTNSNLLGFDGSDQSSTTGSEDAPNWVQMYYSGVKPVVKEVGVEIGFSLKADETPGVGFKIYGGLTLIPCCKYNGNPYSWCNTTAQHSRC